MLFRNYLLFIVKVRYAQQNAYEMQLTCTCFWCFSILMVL